MSHAITILEDALLGVESELNRIHTLKNHGMDFSKEFNLAANHKTDLKEAIEILRNYKQVNTPEEIEKSEHICQSSNPVQTHTCIATGEQPESSAGCKCDICGKYFWREL